MMALVRAVEASLSVTSTSTPVTEKRLVSTGAAAVSRPANTTANSAKASQNGRMIMQRSPYCFISSAIGVMHALESPGQTNPMSEERQVKKSVGYADAGVDISAGNALVEAIKPLARATRRTGTD